MMVKPHGRLVLVSFAFFNASTPSLSPRGLRGALSQPKLEGNLILRLASRLDAFSGYPFPTWLPGNATGVTTGTLAVGPSRSSRTKDRSSQVSCAHGG